jgi:endonuclease/exonuclease/phosphatase (EEP) superfamily protein YafD
LYPYEIGDSEEQMGDSGFSIMTANVLQKNEEMLPLRDEIKRLDADIMVFTETNTRWMNFIAENLPGNYPYRVEVPLDNTYGMLLYSRLELINPEVRYLVDDSIPSIHAKVKLKSGEEFQLYAIHPTPPMPQHNPSSSDRDAEMMKVAKLSRESEIPVIVIGDFNDVSWSATTSLFQRTGKLLDVRVGRGFYNTFNAKNLLLRWPLDHIFTSAEFRLNDLKLGEDIKSDHFPIYASLSLNSEKAQEQAAQPPSLEELKEANRIIENQKEKAEEKEQEETKN